MLSLTSRLLIASSIILASFLGITGFSLDTSFKHSTEDALKERLKAYTVDLIATAALNENGTINLSQTLPETRFMSPGSGLYAQVTSNNGRHAWRSPSMAELKIDLIRKLKPSTHLFQRLIGPHGNEYYAFAISVTLSEDPQQAYTFSVAEDMRKMRAEIGAFRQRLFTLLGGLALVLLIMQIVILHWGLAPLRQAAQDLTAIESGDRRKLQGAYPREIRGLTDNINALLETQHEHLERYRNTLGDLAHSLKTPLTVIRNVVASRNHGADVAGIEEQVNRMSQIIDYQRTMSSAKGYQVLSK